jgi:hypothetical protein
MKVAVVECLNSSTYAVDMVGVYTDMKAALLAVFNRISRQFPAVPPELSYTLTLEEVDKSEIKLPGERNSDRIYISCVMRSPATGWTRMLSVNYSPEYEESVKGAAIQDIRLQVALEPRPDWVKNEQSN